MTLLLSSSKSMVVRKAKMANPRLRSRKTLRNNSNSNSNSLDSRSLKELISHPQQLQTSLVVIFHRLPSPAAGRLPPRPKASLQTTNRAPLASTCFALSPPRASITASRRRRPRPPQSLTGTTASSTSSSARTKPPPRTASS